jgi:FlgD Ig-like domain
MKRTLLSLSVLSLALLASGQRAWQHGQAVDAPQFDADRGTDTVVTAAIAAGPLQIYGSSNGGFVVGTNGYSDKAKAQVFNLGSATVDELLFFFGGKVATSNNPASKVVAKLWALDGTTGTTTAGTGQTCPSTVLSSHDILIGDVDTTGNFTSAPIGPVGVTGAFAVGFDVSTLADGDTVGLVSTAFGNASGESSWELWSDDTWHTLLEQGSWGQDLDLFVAVVFTAVVGVEEEATVNGIHMSLQNGNLIDQEVNVAFTLPVASKASVLVYDATGRQVASEQLGTRAAGKHTTRIDASAWGAGQYYVTLVANGTAMAQKVIKR